MDGQDRQDGGELKRECSQVIGNGGDRAEAPAAS
jgi:hypothetical protein